MISFIAHLLYIRLMIDLYCFPPSFEVSFRPSCINSPLTPLNLQVRIALVVVSRSANKTLDFPAEETILALGRQVLESTESWKVGKVFSKGTVQTLSRAKGPGDGAPWHCRISEHTKEDATFDEFWSKIGVNKAENEKE